MDIGEPVSTAASDDKSADEEPIKFEIRLQDIPGPSGIPLAFTPWQLCRGGIKLLEGKTDEDGIIKVELPASYKGTSVRLLFPGRTISISIDVGKTEELSVHEKMANLGYNVDEQMLTLPGHRELEEYIYNRDKGSGNGPE